MLCVGCTCWIELNGISQCKNPLRTTNSEGVISEYNGQIRLPIKAHNTTTTTTDTHPPCWRAPGVIRVKTSEMSVIRNATARIPISHASFFDWYRIFIFQLQQIHTM